jgi:hypothetical protein
MARSTTEGDGMRPWLEAIAVFVVLNPIAFMIYIGG